MRLAQVKARSGQPGTGELSQALEEARDREMLSRFCSAHVCTPAEVSADGKRLSIYRVLELMRARGYQVSEPTRPQHQPRPGFTAWTVSIKTAKVEFALAFYTTEPARSDAGAARKKTRTRSLEFA